MAANKFTPTEQEQVKAKVARLDRCGWNQYDIAREVGVSQPRISQMLSEIRQAYRTLQREDRHAQINMVIAVLDDLMYEACLALAKSKEPRSSTTTEILKPNKSKAKAKKGERLPGNNGYTKLVKTLEGRLAGAQYMEVILGIQKAKRELLGLDEPKKVDQRNLNFNWDALADPALVEDPGDLVEARLRAEARRGGTEANGVNGNGHTEEP